MREVMRILKRDIGQQFRVSKNLKESRGKKLKRALWATLYLGKGFYCALNAMRREQLGSKVKYKGRLCFVSNWSGSEHPSLSDGKGFYEEGCDRKLIENVHSPSEFYHRFTFGLGFYMGSWYGIDVNRKVYGG